MSGWSGGAVAAESNLSGSTQQLELRAILGCRLSLPSHGQCQWHQRELTGCWRVVCWVAEVVGWNALTRWAVVVCSPSASCRRRTDNRQIYRPHKRGLIDWPYSWHRFDRRRRTDVGRSGDVRPHSPVRPCTQRRAKVRARTTAERRTLADWQVTAGRCRRLAGYDQSETSNTRNQYASPFEGNAIPAAPWAILKNFFFLIDS